MIVSLCAPAQTLGASAMPNKTQAIGKLFVAKIFVARLIITRLWVVSLFAGCVFAALAGTHANAFPDRPIRLLVSFPPGGSTDAIARMVQPGVEKLLGQP